MTNTAISFVSFNGVLYRNGDAIVASFDASTSMFTYFPTSMTLLVPSHDAALPIITALETSRVVNTVGDSAIADNAVTSRIMRELAESNRRPANVSDDDLREFILTTAKPRSTKNVAPLVAAHFAKIAADKIAADAANNAAPPDANNAAPSPRQSKNAA